MKTTLRPLLSIACVGACAATAVFAVDANTPAPSSLSSGGPEALDGRPLLRFALQRIAEELDLTDAQRAAAKDVIRQHHGEVRAALDDARAARAELRDVIRSAGAKEAELSAAADKVAAAAREVALATARLRADLRLVLDEGQRAKVEELEARIQKRVGALRDAVAGEFGPV